MAKNDQHTAPPDAYPMACLWCVWRIETATRDTIGPNAGLVAGILGALMGRRIPNSTAVFHLNALVASQDLTRPEKVNGWIGFQYRTTPSGVDRLERWMVDYGDPVEGLRLELAKKLRKTA